MSNLPKKLLVANRAEIACRIFRTCKQLGIGTVAVYTAEDVGVSKHIALADEAIEVPDYLSMDGALAAAKTSGAEGIHPGYGFLAENPVFSDRCSETGFVFIGPTGDSMRAIGDKSQARDAAKKVGVPITEGVGPFTDVSEIAAAIKQIGTPAMLKAAAGGGGKGMKLVQSLDHIEDLIASSQRETSAAFGDNRMIVERYLAPARHIEVQLMGDGKRAIALGERECSLQRRHQKLIEESPSAAISDSLREKLFDSARKIAEFVGYKNAGTCEFLVTDDGEYFFLEVNARLQVEHPITELCTGLDLVQLQIELAFGGALPAQSSIHRTGYAIEARICAEDPYNKFMPSAGRLLLKSFPSNIRLDEGIEGRVSPKYDSLIAKLISYSAVDRDSARVALLDALKSSAILGVGTNQSYLIQLLESEAFCSAKTYTTTVDSMDLQRPKLSDSAQQAAAVILQGPKPSAHPVWTSDLNWRLA